MSAGVAAPRIDETLRRTMVLHYLTVLGLLYAGVVAAGIAFDDPPTDLRGEAAAAAVFFIGIGVAARAPLHGGRYVAALVCLAAGPVIGLLFHDQLVAQMWSVVPLMFVAMLIRTWHSVHVSRAACTAMTVSALSALLYAPAPIPPFWLIIYATCIFSAAEVAGMINAALLDAAYRDPLTGVWNRAGLHRHTSPLLARARRRSEALAVLMIDVDDFKSVNDRHGHHAGDDVLTGLATRLLQLAPKRSVIARMGGDEFVVITAGCAEHQIAVLANGVVDGHPAQVTCGYVIGSPSAPLEELIDAADADLYRRKRGKRRVDPHPRTATSDQTATPHTSTARFPGTSHGTIRS